MEVIHIVYSHYTEIYIIFSLIPSKSFTPEIVTLYKADDNCGSAVNAVVLAEDIFKPLTTSSLT